MPPANVVVSCGALYGTEATSITAAVSVLGCVGDPYPGMRYTSLPGAIVLAAYPEHSAHSPSPGGPVQFPEVPLVRSEGPAHALCLGCVPVPLLKTERL